MSEVAERIRRLIETRGTSARALSAAAGLSHSTVSAVLEKLDANPDARVEARTLDKIAAALEVDVVWLRTGRGEMDGGAQQKSPDIQSDMRSSVARFFNLPNWPALLRAARAIEPSLPDWVWARLADAAPVLTASPTPVVGRRARALHPPARDTTRVTGNVTGGCARPIAAAPSEG